MAHFDPIRERETYLSDDRMLIRFRLDTKYDPGSPMGNVANCEIRFVISASLSGLFEEVAAIVPRSVDWIQKAIDRDEKCGQNQEFYRYQLHRGKALAIWMRDGANAVDDWDAARQAVQRSLPQGNAYVRGTLGTDYLDDYLACCYQARQYEAGIAEYEKYHGTKALALKKTLAPRKVAYAMCLHEARQEFTTEELFEAGRRMLQAYLGETWIDRGQFDVAAEWLKIVYWHHDPSLSPLQTILKAYDHLPHVQRPDFV